MFKIPTIRESFVYDIYNMSYSSRINDIMNPIKKQLIDENKFSFVRKGNNLLMIGPGVESISTYEVTRNGNRSTRREVQLPITELQPVTDINELVMMNYEMCSLHEVRERSLGYGEVQTNERNNWFTRIDMTKLISDLRMNFKLDETRLNIKVNNCDETVNLREGVEIINSHIRCEEDERDHVYIKKYITFKYKTITKEVEFEQPENSTMGNLKDFDNILMQLERMYQNESTKISDEYL